MAATSRRRRFRHSIRFKLLLVSLTLLLIPLAGYRYIQGLEAFLRQNQEERLLDAARAAAALLGHYEDRFLSGAVGRSEAAWDSGILVHRLESAIQLDGYGTEWQPLLPNSSHFDNGQGTSFSLLAGKHQDYLYLLLRVADRQVVYQRSGRYRRNTSDGVDIALEHPDGSYSRYQVTTTSPGWVRARKLSAGSGEGEPDGSEPRIHGEWQTTGKGYNLELRIPTYLIGDRMAVGVTDIDGPAEDASVTKVSSAPMEAVQDLGWLISRNPQLTQVVGSLGQNDKRIWVVDRESRVLARHGVLTGSQEYPNARPGSVSYRVAEALFRLVLDQPYDSFEDELATRTRIIRPEVATALAGQSGIRRRASPDGRAVILSVSWPIRSPDGVVGAVLVEQSTNQILSLHNDAVKQLFTLSLLLFSVTGLVLVGFATLLTSRIHRLRNRVESAVGRDGRIQGSLASDRARDEIGDLNRSFSSVLARLTEYNRYLESMASRLAHELRTPLSIVRSSLENLEADLASDRRQRYIERAQDGAKRLGKIIHQMQEATRLEQFMKQARLEKLDIAQLVALSTEGYRTAFPDLTLHLNIPATPVWVRANADLISQALDKLINNAIDFHTPGTPLLLECDVPGNNLVRVSVSNQGPTLAPEMKLHLFQSMITIRPRNSGNPHLGLGLYLVKLIMEFHAAEVEARDLPDGKGVAIDLWLPCEPPP